MRLGPCTRVPNSLGIPVVLEAAQMIAAGQCRRRADRGRRRRRSTPTGRPTAPWTRPANEFVVGVRHVHRGGVRADGPAPHAHVRHHARAARHGRGDHPQQRPRAPRRGVLRARPVHAGGHPRLAHGRRPVPPARLRDDLRRRVRRSCWPAPTAPATCRATPVCILGGASDTFGPSYQIAPAWDIAAAAADAPGGLRRTARRGGRVPRPRRSVRTTSTCASSTTRSRSRSSASSRRSGSAAEGEGGDVRDGRRHRARRATPGHHRRRADVVQPRRHQRRRACSA